MGARAAAGVAVTLVIGLAWWLWLLTTPDHVRIAESLVLDSGPESEEVTVVWFHPACIDENTKDVRVQETAERVIVQVRVRRCRQWTVDADRGQLQTAELTGYEETVELSQPLADRVVRVIGAGDD